MDGPESPDEALGGAGDGVDQATHIREQIVFMTEGRVIKHSFVQREGRVE